MSFTAELYANPGKKYGSNAPIAFVSNIGALVEPVNTTSYKGTQKCRGLFSHSHQQMAAQTLQCQVPGAAPKGVGGRMADALSARYKVDSFSVVGSATWSEGFETKREIIGAEGVVRLSNYAKWETVIANMTSQKYGNMYSDEYVQAFGDAIETSEMLGKEIEGVTLETKYATQTRLQKQLYQVARFIHAHKARKAERDFFFVQSGGWDHHRNLLAGFSAKIGEVDSALKGFVEEMHAQSNFDKVVLMTASDFGRTLTFNGAGTDHGWGGNHMVIGGSIQGGRIFNKFLSSYDESRSSHIVRRGRVIPEHPWENMMVPVAEWLGVEEEELVSSVFPNLGRFDRTKHIISCGSLFGSKSC